MTTSSATSSTGWPTSALRAAASAFDTLTAEPNPVLVLDCDALGEGLPAGQRTLAELRDWMLANPTAHDGRDRIWREVLARATGTGPQAGAWLIGAVGLAMPALLSHARTLGEGYRGDHDDLDAEILTGFLAALRGGLDLSRPAPYAKLTFAAWRAGRDARIQEDTYIPTPDMPSAAGSREPRNPFHHPDLLVARAAEMRLIDEVDAAAFIEVKLAKHPSEYVAHEMGISTDCLRMRLVRVGAILSDALKQGLLSGPLSQTDLDDTARKAKLRTRTRAGRGARGTIHTRRNAAAPAL